MGVSIAIHATLDRAPASLEGLKHRVGFIRIITYVRAASGTSRTWWDTDHSIDPSAQSSLTWRDDHLQLHFSSAYFSHTQNVDLDLVYDPLASQWTGSVNRSDVAAHVILVRPHRAPPRSLVGIWMDPSLPAEESACTHILMGDDGRLIIWGTWSRLRDSPLGIKSPATAAPIDEDFGELNADPNEQQVGASWRLDLASSVSGRHVVGELNHAGTVFAGEATRFGNGIQARGGSGQAPAPFTLQRSGDAACAGPFATSGLRPDPRRDP